MQQIYLKRMTKQDITRSVTICTESVDRFWGVSREETSEYMPIKICSENNPTYFPHDITIHKGYQGEKDWRITGSGFKKLYANDEPQELDIMCVKKTNLGNFVLSIIKHDSPAYNILKSFFKGNDNYAIIDVDDEQAETESIHNEKQSLQIIYYGAPGTGKSHKIKEQLEGVAKENIFRTTFHPDSDYSTFVGAYKPTRSKKPLYGLNGGLTVRLNDGEDLNEEIITYKFIPQAFLNAYMRAYSTTDNVYLVIEEINRGNCAQIFGDLFQLLDRDVSGVSEYTIKADADLKAFLEEELGADSDAIKDGELCLPSNLYIYATMNTSDQSLFPIDSAFKRRWDWEYEPIKYKNIDWVIDIKGEKFSWVSFQREINKRIFAANSSEDKMLGDYFVNPYDGIITEKILLNKILFYLWNDVCKDGEGDIFKISETEDVSFSDLHGEGGAEKLIMMMEYLGISGLYDEENGDMTSVGNNQRKRPKYSVNGSSEQFSTPKAVQYIIENYAKQNEHISAEEMIGLWNEISERKNCLIASWSPSPNDNQPFAEKRRVEIKWGNKSAWLITGWTEELFQVFIHNVKAKLGIVIEKVE